MGAPKKRISVSDGTFNCLGLRRDLHATPLEIKVAYHRRALERHPDHNPDDPEAAERFGKIKKAYDLLSDPTQRREWHRRYGLPPPGDGVRAEAKPQPPPRDVSLDLVCTACEAPVRECSACGAGLCRHTAVKIPSQPLEVWCVLCAGEARELARRLQRLKRGFRGRL